MSSDSSFDNAVENISHCTYSLSASDYETSRERGRVLKDINYRNKLKLASEVANVTEKITPLGYMPTTHEMLSDPTVNEITPLLRQLGISGQGDGLSSHLTRKVIVQHDDVRLEGNVPIILNSELFAMIDENKQNNEGESSKEQDEPYDPNRPLQEQFPTIKEFAMSAQQTEDDQNSSSISIENVSNALLNIASTKSVTVSSTCSSVCDESCSSSNNSSITTESKSETNSNDEIILPLLENEQKLYTPRQLYELRKLHLKRSILKDSDHHL